MRGEKFTCSTRRCVGELQLPGPVLEATPVMTVPFDGTTTACGPSRVGRVFDLTGDMFCGGVRGVIVFVVMTTSAESGYC